MEKEHNLLIVSDLHLGEGLDPESGKTSCLEDFLFGDAFARFSRLVGLCLLCFSFCGPSYARLAMACWA